MSIPDKDAAERMSVNIAGPMVTFVEDWKTANFIITHGGVSNLHSNCVCAEILDDGSVCIYGEITPETTEPNLAQQSLPILTLVKS